MNRNGYTKVFQIPLISAWSHILLSCMAGQFWDVVNTLLTGQSSSALSTEPTLHISLTRSVDLGRLDKETYSLFSQLLIFSPLWERA